MQVQPDVWLAVMLIRECFNPPAVIVKVDLSIITLKHVLEIQTIVVQIFIVLIIHVWVVLCQDAI